MMNPLAVFSFQENHQVRIQIIDDEPWFCLRDVCEILSVDRTSRLLRDLTEKGVANCHTLTNGGMQELAFVNEPNLYRVIFRSNKPEARQFQDWVFSDVLPAIRKTGGYQFSPVAPKPAGEPLSRKDQNELAWLINDIAQSFKFSNRWVSGIWYALRRATGNPSPNPILTTELPVVVHELRRILQAAEYANRHMSKYESELLKTVVRCGRNVTAIGSLELVEPNDDADQESLPARFEVALGRLQHLERGI